MESVEVLRRSELFGGLEADILAELASMGRQMRFIRGQLIFDQGRPADRLGLLAGGAVHVRSVMPDQGDVLVETVTRPGGVFGWSSLVEPYVYSFSCRAHEDGSALVFAGAELRRFLDVHPEAGLAVYRALAGIVGRRLEQTRSSLQSVLSRGTISQG